MFFLGKLGPAISGIRKKIATMTIQTIVEQALTHGYLTPTMEAEVGRICDNAADLSVEEYQALDQLMGSLLSGQIVAVPRKQFINVMEELVLTEAITRVSQIESSDHVTLDLGDIAAYALNRLPPLYATTEEGASYQRQRAQEELMGLITLQVQTAIDRNLDRPEFFPDRQALDTKAEDDVLGQVSSLLQSYAPDFEEPVKVS